MCEECDVRSFLRGQEWKILQDNEVIVNYSKDPEVDGHLVIQPRRHVEKITELSYDEWTRISEALYHYSKAVEKALNGMSKGDEVDKVYLWCFCRSPHNHLHFHIKPKMKNHEEEGPDFVDYEDPGRQLDEKSQRSIIDEIKKFL
jgi:diadenosine tetraphosphate (Ap4A) HIT family hydrolase